MNHPLPRAGHTSVTRLVPAQRLPEEKTAFQGTLALDLEGMESPPPPPETAEVDHGVRSRRADDTDAQLRAWAGRLAEALVEAAAGQRPVSQLVRWTTPQVQADLARRARAVRAVGGPPSRRVRPQVRSLHLCRPAAHALEVSVHVRHGERSRAVALRLEQKGDRWICAAMQYG